MCILSFLPGHAELDTDALWNGGISNPDGHGWAIADTKRGQMIVGKSMKLSQSIDTFTDARKAHPGMPALFHSRWATHGTVNTVNCHPFYVGGSAQTVVGHNGILPGEAHPAKGDDRSDTRKFADDILSTRYRRLDKTRAFQALSRWAGSYNKLVILTVDPRYRRSVYLVNEKAGHWDSHSGIWHSNFDYLDTPKWLDAYRGATLGRSTVVTGTLEEICYLCELGTIDSDGFCKACGTCADCLESAQDCQCYLQGLKADILARYGENEERVTLFDYRD